MPSATNLRAWARDACGHALSLVGATAPASRLRHRLSIITFHRVLTEDQRRAYPLPGLAVTPDELDAHLRFAARHFRCAPLAEALTLRKQRGSDPRPLLAVTFDDGQLDNHVNALPVLERHGIKASFFVTSRTLQDTAPLWHDALSSLLLKLAPLAFQGAPSASASLRSAALERLTELGLNPGSKGSTGSIDIESTLEHTKRWPPARRAEWIQRASALFADGGFEPWDGFMTIQHLKDLLQKGHEIGSHSHTHPLLPQCTSEELIEEIAGSKRRLEAALDAPVTSFCYPNGSADDRAVEQVRQAGYCAAVTTRWGSNLPTQNPHLLHRFDMNARHAMDRHGRFSETRLAWRMSGLHPGLSEVGQDAYAHAAS